MTPLDRKLIEAEPWFGEQRAQVLALLDRAEAADREVGNQMALRQEVERERDAARRDAAAAQATVKRFSEELQGLCDAANGAVRRLAPARAPCGAPNGETTT